MPLIVLIIDLFKTTGHVELHHGRRVVALTATNNLPVGCRGDGENSVNHMFVHQQLVADSDEHKPNLVGFFTFRNLPLGALAGLSAIVGKVYHNHKRCYDLFRADRARCGMKLYSSEATRRHQQKSHTCPLLGELLHKAVETNREAPMQRL